MNSGQPFAESDPSVSPWKPWSHETTRARPVAARPSLSAASTASVPLLVKRQRSIRPPAMPIELLGEQAGQERRPHREHPRRVEPERLDERGADARVVAADVVHPEPAEHVEIAVAVGVEEVRALGARPRAVEADRLEDARELRVDRARPEVEILAAAGLEQLRDAELAIAIDSRWSGVNGRIGGGCRPRRALARLAVVASAVSPRGGGTGACSTRPPLERSYLTVRVPDIPFVLVLADRRVEVILARLEREDRGGRPLADRERGAVFEFAILEADVVLRRRLVGEDE